MLLITYFVYTVSICTPFSIIAVVCWSIYVILIIGPLGPAFIGILYTKYCISFVLSPFKTFLHARWSPSLFCHSSRALIFETAKWGVLKLCKIDKLPWYAKISSIWYPYCYLNSNYQTIPYPSHGRSPPWWSLSQDPSQQKSVCPAHSRVAHIFGEFWGHCARPPLFTHPLVV